jgi:hypothetical protein
MNSPSTSSGFSEAAVLYAQNLPVIEKMEELFERELDRFFDKLRRKVAEALDVSPEVVREELHPSRVNSHRYWWFAAGEKTDHESDHAYLWFYDRLPSIVAPGELKVTANIEKQFSPLRPIYAATATRLSPHPGMRIVRGVEGGLYSLDLTYESDNALDTVPPALADSFRLLTECEKLAPLVANT